MGTSLTADAKATPASRTLRIQATIGEGDRARDVVSDLWEFVATNVVRLSKCLASARSVSPAAELQLAREWPII